MSVNSYTETEMRGEGWAEQAMLDLHLLEICLMVNGITRSWIAEKRSDLFMHWARAITSIYSQHINIILRSYYRRFISLEHSIFVTRSTAIRNMPLTPGVYFVFCCYCIQLHSKLITKCRHVYEIAPAGAMIFCPIFCVFDGISLITFTALQNIWQIIRFMESLASGGWIKCTNALQIRLIHKNLFLTKMFSLFFWSMVHACNSCLHMKTIFRIVLLSVIFRIGTMHSLHI